MKMVLCDLCNKSFAAHELPSHLCLGLDLLASSTSKSTAAAAAAPSAPQLSDSLDAAFDPLYASAAPSAPPLDAAISPEIQISPKPHARVLVVSDAAEALPAPRSSSSSSSSSSSAAATVACPLCRLTFGVNAIESHVAECLDAPVRAVPAPAARGVALKGSAGDMALGDQEKHLELWKKRREAEAADRALAERLAREADAPIAAPRPSPPVQVRAAVRIDDEDHVNEALARRLAAEDGVLVPRVDEDGRADEELARRLAAEDARLEDEAASLELARQLHAEEQALAAAEARAAEASARAAAEFARRERELAEREREQKAREARELVLAEVDMLAEERRRLERERRLLDDEKLAARLHGDAELERVRAHFQREKLAIEQRVRAENWYELQRLQREKAALEARLRQSAINGVAHLELADGSRIAVHVDRQPPYRRR